MRRRRRFVSSRVAALALAVLAVGCSDSPDATEDRIDALFGDVPFGTVDRGQVRRMLDVPSESDRPFYMVNFIHYRAHAEYRDGRETDLTGAQADAVYGSLVMPILASIGAQIIFVANVETSPIDPDAAGWNQIAVVLYPSRAGFIAMLERPDFRDAAVHKIAGVERSIVLVTEPSENQFPEELRRVDLSALPFPPTPSDPPVNLVHLLEFNERAMYADGRETDLTGREAMALYEQGRAPQAFPLGVRPGLTLAVEGELIGDGRRWDEFRINNFPSRAAFAELTRRESLAAAGYEHREAALADTYAVVAAPLINEVGYIR